MTVSVSYVLTKSDRFEPHGQPTGDGTGAIGSVQINPYSPGYTCIQADDPATLRRLASALLNAADAAEAILAGVQ